MFAIPLTKLKFGITLFLIFLVFKYQFIEERIFLVELITQGYPVFNLSTLLKTAFIAIISLIFVIYIALNFPKNALFADHSSGFVRLVGWGVLLANLAVVVLFIINPTLFTRLQFEDFVVEYLSAGLLLAAAGMCAFHAFMLRRSVRQSPIPLILLLLAGFFFVVGMEEISWFQRIIGFETPASFDANRQGEFNLHNFASNLSEEIYYASAFILLVLFPFIYSVIPSMKQSKVLTCLVPGKVIMVVGMLQAAYNFHLWNRVSTQYVFFCTVFILMFMIFRAMNSTESRNDKWFMLLMLVSIVGTQAIFLLRADTILVQWSSSEYKELFIALAVALS